MFEPFIEAMPKSLQHLPVYLVAVHPAFKMSPDDSGWLDCNQGWVWTMYHAVDAWNRRGGQQVRCALLYRYPGTDEWALRRRTHVIEDFWQSLGMGYTPYLRPAEPVRATAGAAEMEAQCARAEAGVSVGLVRPGVGVWDDVPETAWLRSPDIPANMLTNGGFEADWNAGGDHQCLAVIDSATAEKRTVENIFTPPGWITWFRHAPGTWDQPEVRHIPVTGDARRVHSGQQSMLLFTFFRRHDAGFLQQAPAAPGAWMRLSAWAHAWSNHRLEGYETCEDDPYCSCGVGREAFAALVGTVPKPNGENSWVDAISNFTFQVGIDPTGGLNPLSDSVVWGQGMHIYNAYAPVPPVEVQAVNDTVTVFLRSTTLWGFKHCDAYWDDIELLPVGPQSSRPRVDLGYTPQAPTVGQTVTVEARASAPLSGVILEVRPPSGMPIRPTNLRVTPGAGCVVWTGTVSLEHAGTHELVFSADDGVWASTTFQCHVSTPAPRGAPRTQYRRTYVLLPPNAGEEWALAVVDGAWDAKRYTVGGSADDAGIGDLDVREVLAVNPVGWAGDLAKFFATHYPGVRYESITASSPDDLRSKLQARVGG